MYIKRHLVTVLVFNIGVFSGSFSTQEGTRRVSYFFFYSLNKPYGILVAKM